MLVQKVVAVVVRNTLFGCQVKHLEDRITALEKLVLVMFMRQFIDHAQDVT